MKPAPRHLLGEADPQPNRNQPAVPLERTRDHLSDNSLSQKSKPPIRPFEFGIMIVATTAAGAAPCRRLHPSQLSPHHLPCNGLG